MYKNVQASLDDSLSFFCGMCCAVKEVVDGICDHILSGKI